MRKWIFSALLLNLVLPIAAFAADQGPYPVIVASPAAVAVTADPGVSAGAFLDQVLAQVQGFGGMSWTLKIATIILLLIGSMKVSAARPLWDKLGAGKAFAAPLLSLLAGIFSLGVGPQHITLQGVFAYLFAGAGAIILHELLDAVKAMPGIGPAYGGAITFLQGFLKAPPKADEAPKA